MAAGAGTGGIPTCGGTIPLDLAPIFEIALNSLVLDDPILIVHAGVCGHPQPILSCPNGTDTIDVVFPPDVPPGLSISVQAIVSVPSGPAIPSFSFTQAITFTVL